MVQDSLSAAGWRSKTPVRSGGEQKKGWTRVPLAEEKNRKRFEPSRQARALCAGTGLALPCLSLDVLRIQRS